MPSDRDEERGRRLEQNVFRTFALALGVGLLGLGIFAGSVAELPPAEPEPALLGRPAPSPEKPTTTTTVAPTATTTATVAPTATTTAPETTSSTEAATSPTTSTSSTTLPSLAERCGTPCRLAPADVAPPTGWRVFGLGVLGGGAAALLGALLGFLFGLPRMPSVPRPSARSGNETPERQGQEAAAGAKTDAGKGAAESSAMETDGFRNNNLIEISDWLAKIIVGAGLVGIKDLTPWVGSVGTALGVGAGLGDGYLASAFGVTVIMYFVTLGFLFTYINTRTVVTHMLAISDRLAMSALLGNMAEQARQDIAAEVREAERVTQTAAKQALAAASSAEQSAAESQIFSLLYSGDPGAPVQAVKAASEFLAKPGNEDNARVWLYLACARGQVHARETDATKKAHLAQEAFEALKRAIELEPGLRPIARGLLDPTDPNHFPGDDDLVSLGDDQRFRVLVEEPKPTPQSAPKG